MVNVSEVEVRFEKIGFERDCMLVQRLRFDDLIPAVMHIRQVDQAGDETRIEFERFPIRGGCLLELQLVSVVERRAHAKILFGKRGVALVENLMGDAVGRLYVERHFPPDAKARMDELVANLREAYRVSITDLEWMTPETRQRALEKLDKFTPSPYFSFSVHLDGLREEHDRAVDRGGIFDIAVSAIAPIKFRYGIAVLPSARVKLLNQVPPCTRDVRRPLVTDRQYPRSGP